MQWCPPVILTELASHTLWFPFYPNSPPCCFHVTYISSLHCVFSLLFSFPPVVSFLPHPPLHKYRLHIIFCSSIHFPQIPCFFDNSWMKLYCVIMCHIFIIHLSVYKLLSWFHFLAIVDSPAIKTYIQLFVSW